VSIFGTSQCPTFSTPPLTQNLGPHTVNHEVQAALCLLLEGVHTQEELDEVLRCILDIWCVFLSSCVVLMEHIRIAQNQVAQEQLIHHPLVVNPKG
jgi:hypothetical protein